MTTTTTSRRDGVNSGAAIKVACRCATTANITLSGYQTIDGILPTSADSEVQRRVLVKDQTDTTENGIYIMDTGTWSRAVDFDTNRDVATGTLVLVNFGTTLARTVWRLTTTGTITFGTSAITFESAPPVLGGDFATVATIAALKALTGMSDGQVVYVTSYDTAATPDGGGGPFKYDSSSSATDNGGTVIAADAGGVGRWRRIYSGAVNVDWFGAKGDGATDDATAIQAAINAASAIESSPKTYMVGTQINVVAGKFFFSNGSTFKPTTGSVDVFLIQNQAKLLGYPSIDTTGVTYTGKAVTVNTATASMSFVNRSVVTFRASGTEAQGTGLYVHNNAGVNFISGLSVDCTIKGYDYGIDLYSQHATGWLNGNTFNGYISDTRSAMIRLRGAGAASGNVFNMSLQPSATSQRGILLDKGSSNHFNCAFWDNSLYTAIPVDITGADGTPADNSFIDVLGAFFTAPAITNTPGTWYGFVGPYFNKTKGIQFPATQAASSDVNMLDDYEEGSWTPAFTFATPGDLNVAYSTQVGRYTKVGNTVTCHFILVTSAFTHTTASGNALITGFPFTSANVSGLSAVGPLVWTGITKAGYTQISPLIGASQTSAALYASGSASALATVSAANMPTGGSVQLIGQVVYQTA